MPSYRAQIKCINAKIIPGTKLENITIQKINLYS